MKLYADRVPVALRQLLTDIAVVIWVYAWIRAGLWIHDTVLKLGVPGQKIEGAGTGIADNLADAGSKVGRGPRRDASSRRSSGTWPWRWGC